MSRLELGSAENIPQKECLKASVIKYVLFCLGDDFNHSLAYVIPLLDSTLKIPTICFYDLLAMYAVYISMTFRMPKR